MTMLLHTTWFGARWKFRTTKVINLVGFGQEEATVFVSGSCPSSIFAYLQTLIAIPRYRWDWDSSIASA